MFSKKVIKIMKRNAESGYLAKYARTPAGKQAIFEGKMEALDGFGNSHK